MPKHLQIRNVPERVHRRLKARAAMAGMTLQELALEELTRIAELPTRSEILARIAARDPIADLPPVEELLREEREGR